MAMIIMIPKGERPADEDAGVDVATVALLEAEVDRTCGSQRQSGRRSSISRRRCTWLQPK